MLEKNIHLGQRNLINMVENPGQTKSRRRITINVASTQYDLVKSVATSKMNWRINTRGDNAEWDVLWSDSAVKPETLSKMRGYQKINHFPGMYMLSRKNFLAKNLNRMRRHHPQDYSFYPRTWILPTDYSDLKTCSNTVFIVKPEASSQGKGIFLTRSLEDFTATDRCVVQEYIKDPLLIEGHKFDIRLYVLLTGCNPLRAYIHKEGLVRVATKEYCPPTLSNMHKQCMHLTNYAINKNNRRFEHTKHKRSLTETMKDFDRRGLNTARLWSNIKGIVVKTLCCIQPSLSHTYRACQPSDLTNSMCFELLGFDILVDSNLRPWLLEVNHSPSFKSESAIDFSVKGAVIEESLVLINVKTSARKEYEIFKKKDLQLKIYQRNREDEREKRKTEAAAIQEQRDEWELQHLGGFQSLFTNNDKEINAFLRTADEIWTKWTGSSSKTRFFSRQQTPAAATRNHKKARTLDLNLKNKTQKVSSSFHVESSKLGRTSPMFDDILNEKKVLEGMKRTLALGLTQPITRRGTATPSIDRINANQTLIFPKLDMNNLRSSLHRGAIKR